MEQFLKNADQLNPTSIKSLASQKKLRDRVKPNDTFFIPTPESSEIEALLNESQIKYKKETHPTYNLIKYTALN